jgi:hypothetical protein
MKAENRLGVVVVVVVVVAAAREMGDGVDVDAIWMGSFE